MSDILMVMKKEVLQLSRNRWVLFSALAMPLILMAVAGFAFTEELKDIPTAIVDKDGGVLNQNLVDALNETDVLDIKYRLDNASQAENMLRDGLIKVAIIIPENFGNEALHGNASVQVMIDGSDPVSASKALSAMQAFTLSFSPKITVKTDETILFNPDLRQIDYICPGILGAILQAFPIMFIAMSIAGERERGTIEQLIITPIKGFSILLGKLFVYLAVGLINAFSMLALATFIFGLPLTGGSHLLVLVFFLIFLLAILSQGILASAFSRTQLQAVLSLLPLIYVPIFISGTFYPIEAVPNPIRTFSYIFPLTYMNNALRLLLVKGAGLSTVAMDLAALTCYTLLLMAVSIALFKKRLW